MLLKVISWQYRVLSKDLMEIVSLMDSLSCVSDCSTSDRGGQMCDIFTQLYLLDSLSWVSDCPTTDRGGQMCDIFTQQL